jgi:serine/arginine repetitive matrix protein 2
VSFDPEPEVVGPPAQQSQTEGTLPANPTAKDSTKRGWFGLGKGRSASLGTIPAEDDIEDVMTPRPALPFFGSVRNKPRGTEPVESTPNHQAQPSAASAASTLSSTSSETSSTSNIPTLNTSVSSDHAIGALLSEEALKGKMETSTKPIPKASNLPLPPEVTSVEGTGYESDTDSNPEPNDPTPKTSQPEPSHIEAAAAQSELVKVQPISSSNAAKPLPTIAIHPATPGLKQNETRVQDQWQVQVPGGFPLSNEQQPSHPTSELKDQPILHVATTSPSGLGIAETKPPKTVGMATEGGPPLNMLSQALLGRHNGEGDDKDSDADSIYSDAAESQADLEGDGFGSINAIVESPVPESPLARNLAPNRPDGSDPTASWDNAQAHWSVLAERYRQGLLQAPADHDRVTPPESKPKTRRKTKAPVAAAAVAPEAAIPVSQRFMDSSPSALQKKQQDAAATQSGRATSTTAGQGFARQSMKPQTGLAPAPSPQSQPLPPAAPTPAPAPKHRGTLQKRHIPSAVPARPVYSGPPGAPLQRTFSNDSDSESSFKKQRRRAKSGGDGSYSMRRSMRAPEPPRPTELPGRGGVRSLSPINRRPFSPVGSPKTMRSTMRGSIDSAGPAVPAQPTLQRSSSLFGRSKSKAMSPVRNSAPPKPPTSKIKSRFADSDDEGGPVPKTFRSRFEESSDEEPEPIKFRPVRGIPRKTDEGESTDLEDSSDEEARAQKSKTPPKINTQLANAAAYQVEELPLSPTSEKKRGFFGRFMGKKVKNSDKPKLEVGTIAERDTMLDRTRSDAQDPEYVSTPTKKIEDKNRASRLGFGSFAERDAMIERTRVQLEEAREQAGSPNSPTAGRGAQRRPMRVRIMSDSWPLPPKIFGAEANRPNTADGVEATPSSSPTLHTGINGGRNSVETPSSASTAVYGRSGKKKRFPMLRRAFGLTD